MNSSNETMNAMSYPEFGRLEVARQPRPIPAADEVLIRVAACGICGSELETFKARSTRRQPPLIMGHEFCGVIDEVGEQVGDWETGARVVSNSLVPCGNCIRCRRGDSHLCAHREIFGMHRMGAFAEFVAVPSRCLLPWPEGVSAEAASLAEPLANGIHMVNLTRHLSPQTVLVIGAGPIGLMAQQAFAVLANCTVYVADLSTPRLDVARRLGAAEVFDPRAVDVVAEMQALTEGEGVDLVVDAVGSAFTKRQSATAARPGGAAIWIGLHEDEMTFNSYNVTLPERQIFGTYAATITELSQALELMERGQVDVTSWVHQAKLDESVDLFNRMLRAENDDIKGIVIPQKSL